MRRWGEVSASPPPDEDAWRSGEEARRLGELPRGGLGEFVSSGTGVYLVRVRVRVRVRMRVRVRVKGER